LVFGFWFLVCYAGTQLATQLHQKCIQVQAHTFFFGCHNGSIFGFWFLVCYAATQLANQSQQTLSISRENLAIRPEWEKSK